MIEERLVAHQKLFKGQSNVRVVADELGCSIESLQESFSEYVSMNPVTDEEWQKDAELSWPFA